MGQTITRAKIQGLNELLTLYLLQNNVNMLYLIFLFQEKKANISKK